jgi:hypothetical protein
VLDKNISLPSKTIWVSKNSNLDELVKTHAHGGGIKIVEVIFSLTFLSGHPWDESRRKKLRSVFETVQNTNGWAVIGKKICEL